MVIHKIFLFRLLAGKPLRADKGTGLSDNPLDHQLRADKRTEVSDNLLDHQLRADKRTELSDNPLDHQLRYFQLI